VRARIHMYMCTRMCSNFVVTYMCLIFRFQLRDGWARHAAKKCIAKKNRSLVLMNMFFLHFFFHMAKTMPARQ
jgi:hypothetical protein